MKKLKNGIRGSGSSGGNQMASVKAMALMTGDSNVRGSLHFRQASTGGPTHIQGRISGLSPGLHGFHIHALGDTSNGCNSTGPHFNPLKKEHGAPSDKERHAGDLGNIVAGPDGVAEVSLQDWLVDMNLARLLGTQEQELDVVSLALSHLFEKKNCLQNRKQTT
ncbi:superoxide dismutase [Cu-Zn] 2-like isoform X4 [Malus sylvestris]|uniref:superoxide dismutase [Cu-Zn] 2-like isoform X4 n=1 Tax=Malus sylvestris TaxID=3752 RepID=UPI0021AD4DD6|nr:superoxide dismutase [Cu-Zn] 2-like isoform X4 [Malus sylvestris]